MPKRKRKNKLPYLFILVVLVSVFVMMAIQARNREENEGGNTGSYTNIEQEDDKDEKASKREAENENDDNETEEEIERKAVQYDGDSPNKLDNLTGIINYASVSGDKFLIRVSIDQYLEDGTCELLLMQDGEVAYHDVVDIMGDATASTCKGFDVPMTVLGSGEVQFTVYLSSGDRAGEISGGIEL